MPVSYIQTEESFLFEEMLRLEYALMTQYIQLCHVVGDAEFLKTAACRLGAHSGIYIHHSDICDTCALPKEFDNVVRSVLLTLYPEAQF